MYTCWMNVELTYHCRFGLWAPYCLPYTGNWNSLSYTSSISLSTEINNQLTYNGNVNQILGREVRGASNFQGSCHRLSKWAQHSLRVSFIAWIWITKILVGWLRVYYMFSNFLLGYEKLKSTHLSWLTCCLVSKSDNPNGRQNFLLFMKYVVLI